MKYLLSTVPILIIILTLSGCNNQGKTDQYLFVGTYTGESSEGIYIYKFNTETGEVDSVGAAKGVENPSYLAVSEGGDYLYAVNEIADSTQAAVSAFSFNKATGTLSFLNKQPSRGGAPCYVSLDKQDNTVFAANYGGGSLSAFPVKSDGSLQAATTTIEHKGSSVNKNRQQSPHVHCTIVAPDNSHLYVTDLGTDQVTAYNYSSGNALLSEEASFTFKTDPGAGPRHLTFHPKKPYAYLVNEINGTIVAFRRTADSLKAIQTVSTLPEGYDGAISGADIHVSPDGNFLYASYREDLNDIVIYQIDATDGSLSYVERQPSGGVHPRNFMIDPSGRFLLVANRNTDNIVIFQRDKDTGKLSKTGTDIAVSQPVCLKMTPAN